MMLFVNTTIGRVHSRGLILLSHPSYKSSLCCFSLAPCRLTGNCGYTHLRGNLPDLPVSIHLFAGRSETYLRADTRKCLCCLTSFAYACESAMSTCLIVIFPSVYRRYFLSFFLYLRIFVSNTVDNDNPIVYSTYV